MRARDVKGENDEEDGRGGKKRIEEKKSNGGAK